MPKLDIAVFLSGRALWKLKLECAEIALRLNLYFVVGALREKNLGSIEET